MKIFNRQKVSVSSKEKKLSVKKIPFQNNHHSHIGQAALNELEANHSFYQEKLWAKTSGAVVEKISHTPRGTWDHITDPKDGHSDWFPNDLATVLAKTEIFCDFTSLSPPDGLFMKKIKEALRTVAQRSKDNNSKIIIRFLFGNVLTVPTDCDALIKEFTADLPVDSKLEIWVGAWRKGLCWNHAKIVAVDGKEVYTGGHNLYDPAYLEKDPIHDTSIRMTGAVTIQAHLFMNEQWEFIRKKQSTILGWIVNKFNDGMCLPVLTRVTLSAWPKTVSKFTHLFTKDLLPQNNLEAVVNNDTVSVLSLGRYANIANNANSSDAAFIAMFDAAQSSMRFILQDLGPDSLIIAGKKIVYKPWPKEYFRSWSRAIFLRGVDIEIVLSNPTAGEERGNYSNGWSLEKVTAEIMKTMKEQFPNVSYDKLISKVKENLRICFLRNKGGNTWAVSKNKVGLHSKVFIIDEVSTYIGSQNLYAFDLAEWGVVIDDKKKTAEIMEELWNPMWKCSYLDGCDCDEDRVI